MASSALHSNIRNGVTLVIASLPPSNVGLVGGFALHLAAVIAVAQIDAIFDIGLHAGQHLRPALAVEVGFLQPDRALPPAALGDGDEGAAIVQRLEIHLDTGL